MNQSTIPSDGRHADAARLVQAESGPVRDQVVLQFHEAAANQDKHLQPLNDDLVLLESGLDSLCFAIIVARLEDQLGIDPFSNTEEGFPVTLGEFIKFYENAAK